MPTISELVPDADALLALEPEELAGPLLYFLASLEPMSQFLHPGQFMTQSELNSYPSQHHNAIQKALIEAWVWLEREGLIAPRPKEGRDGWIFVTRRGNKVARPDDFKAYQRANLLPHLLLHPKVAQKVSATFLRGDYDTAVFQAFKEVEVRVREVGGYQDSDIGVPLMRKAFAPGPKAGPLTDTSVGVPEQESLMHLFAGAIGCYKNPHSHRHVTIEPTEAVEMLVLASHLLGIVDQRAP